MGVHMKSEPPFHLCFETLSNDLRLRIIRELSEGPRTVSQLSAGLGVEQSRLSHSLAMLKTCRFVESTQRGKNRLYALHPLALPSEHKSDIFKAMKSHHELACGGLCHKNA